MTPIYNRYLKPKYNTRHYSSEFAFVSSQNNIISKELYYVDFHPDSPFKPGVYLDNNKNELYKINSEYLEMSHKHIRKITRYIKYYTYVKIIKDYNNPQLEGQIMIFSFGRLILNMLSANSFNKTFRVNINIRCGFPDYRESHFTETDTNLVDNGLNLESEFNYKTLNFTAFERKEKLKNIKSGIELKDLRYKKYLKLKEEFEN